MTQAHGTLLCTAFGACLQGLGSCWTRPAFPLPPGTPSLGWSRCGSSRRQRLRCLLRGGTYCRLSERGPQRPRCPRGEERGKGAAGGSETSLLFRAPSCCFLLALSKSAPFPAALALGFLTAAVLGSVPGLGVRAELPAHVFVFTAISPFAIFPQEILQLTQAAIKKVLENYLQMPDCALEAIGMQTESLTALALCMALPQGLPGSAFEPEKYSLMHCFDSSSLATFTSGAAIDKERTSKSYGGQGKKTWWLPPFGFSSANPPETILQVSQEKS